MVKYLLKLTLTQEFLKVPCQTQFYVTAMRDEPTITQFGRPNSAFKICK